MKESLLQEFNPIEIHKSLFEGTTYKKIYEDQPDYSLIENKDVLFEDICYRTGKYFKKVALPTKQFDYFLYY